MLQLYYTANFCEHFSSILDLTFPKRFKIGNFFIFSFIIFGSNDNDCKTKNRIPLLEVTDAGFTAQDQFKSWEIPLQNQQEFRCIFFKFISTNVMPKHVGVTDVMMWENMWTQRAITRVKVNWWWLGGNKGDRGNFLSFSAEIVQ